MCGFVLLQLLIALIWQIRWTHHTFNKPCHLVGQRCSLQHQLPHQNLHNRWLLLKHAPVQCAEERHPHSSQHAHTSLSEMHDNYNGTQERHAHPDSFASSYVRHRKTTRTKHIGSQLSGEGCGYRLTCKNTDGKADSLLT